MDLEDILKLLIPFLFFGISTLGRLTRGRRRTQTKPGEQRQPAPSRAKQADLPIYGSNEESPADETHDGYGADDDLDDYGDDEFSENYVEPDRSENAPAYVFTLDRYSDLSLSDDIQFVEREASVFTDAFDDREAPIADEESHALRGLRAQISQLESQRTAKLVMADRIREPSSDFHLSGSDLHSVEIVRDALVLDAILHRPSWGRLPLRRRSSS